MKKLIVSILAVLLVAGYGFAADTKGSALDATGGVDAANDKLYVIDATGPSSKADTVQTVVNSGLAAPGAIGGTTPAAGTFTTLTCNTALKLYDGNSHHTTLAAGDSTANLTFTFPTAYPAASGYLMLMSDAGVISTTNSLIGLSFDLGNAPAAGAGAAVAVDADGILTTTLTALLPDSAGGADLGSATAEWGDVYLKDSAVIKGQADQSNTITSSATGWAFALPITAGVKFDDVDGSTTGDLTTANVSRTLVNSYGRSGAATLTLPAAAEGLTFIALVGTQHNSAWKIQRAGSDTITWSSGGTDTTGKTYFQETNQAVGSRVSCITYRSGASAYTWLCGSITGTWATD